MTSLDSAHHSAPVHFPFSALQGQAALQQALLLVAVTLAPRQPSAASPRAAAASPAGEATLRDEIEEAIESREGEHLRRGDLSEVDRKSVV